MSCNQQDWEHQVAYFKKEAQCIMIDLRGHGDSEGTSEQEYTIEIMAMDAIDVLNKLSDKSVVLIGHSMGCRIIMEMYSQIPEKISHLILVDGSKMTEGDPKKVHAEMTAFVDTPQYGELMQQFFKDMLSDVTDEELKNRILKNAARMPRGIGKKLAPNMAVWDAVRFEQILQEITIPVSLIQSTYLSPARRRSPLKEGDTSPFIQWFEKAIPTLQVHIIHGTGHFPMLEKSKEVNQSITNFLESYK